MALLGAYIDSRTLAGLAAAGTVSYAHGLGVDPDFVIIQHIATAATNVSAFKMVSLTDATNVTVQNDGEGTSPNFKAVAVRAHSIIR